MKKAGKKGRFWELMPAAAVLGLLAVILTGVTFFLNRTVFFVELIALAAYEILPTALVVHIVYMEAQPESNPTLDGGTPKYRGIGRLLIAYGIKLSIDSGLTGDVVLEAKTTSLAKHYEEDFGAVLLPTFQSSAPRYLIADEAAKRIFFTYLD